MNDICLITGDHPRHLYFAKSLAESGRIACWVIETREHFVPAPPANIDPHLRDLFDEHFAKRENTEMKFFGNTRISDVGIPYMQVTKESLNARQTAEFIAKHQSKLVISYGCHKLQPNFMAAVSATFWNTHGGLSPQYRGVATHFWPSYFLEPQMTGMTLHETTSQLDGGGILFQTAAPLVRGDTLHALAARNVEYYAMQLSEKLNALDVCNLPSPIKQKTYGKVFMAKDWRPEHLRLIYDVYGDSIVDLVLDSELRGREPELLSAFDE
ncbi:methionyl-tRNA formyltransferase [Idiomarina tyrosinivorans]|uniref:phosphoribosylglycinamide formyltransferase 1 n=1 Tax=Idiomarina tyrosinivorans TaxID=1445662 RepID=A0A432ZR29_9GAMM|nr:formyl transferase [Idiomarina tyrosinivorans]RUO80286.1 methionyl-tRNA formyltransferase [Idiomarina tyrosinivorans]